MGVVGRSVAFYPSEDLGSDARECAVVCVFAAADEIEAEINVLLVFEHETGKEEITSVETGHCISC